VTPRCRGVARPGRSCCSKCQDRKWRAKYPEQHLWKNLKASAKRRGVPFTLTLDEFKEFCARTKYHELVGRDPDAASCDRRDDTKGYTAENIRCLEFGLNSGRPKLRNRTVTPELDLNEPSSSHYAPEEDPLQS
jgi:hypothetical protein